MQRLTITVLLALALAAGAAGQEPNAITPSTDFPDIGGAAAVQYGPSDWRIIVRDVTVEGRVNSTMTPNAITLVAIEIQQQGNPTRTRVFEWRNSNIAQDIVDETAFTYTVDDYPGFEGFPVAPGATYDVFLVSRDIDDPATFSNLIATVDVGTTSAASETQGTTLH